jgi:hypothetical protein
VLRVQRRKTEVDQLATATKPRTAASIWNELAMKVCRARMARDEGDTQGIELVHDQINVLLDRLEDAQ